MKLGAFFLVLYFLGFQLFAGGYKISLRDVEGGTPQGMGACEKINISKSNPGAISEGEVIKLPTSRKNMSVVLVRTRGNAEKFTQNSIRKNAQPGCESVLKFLRKPTVYDSINKYSEEYKLYSEAIAKNTRAVGRTYGIELETLKNNTVKLDVLLKIFDCSFHLSENLFSDDEATINYSETPVKFSASIELNKDYVVFLEKTTNVREATSFFGKIPLIGSLFTTDTTATSLDEVCIINISSN